MIFSVAWYGIEALNHQDGDDALFVWPKCCESALISTASGSSSTLARSRLGLSDFNQKANLAAFAPTLGLVIHPRPTDRRCHSQILIAASAGTGFNHFPFSHLLALFLLFTLFFCRYLTKNDLGLSPA
jgi:hypothetical protein